MKMLPTPDFRRKGSRRDQMIRQRLPLIRSKFMVLIARSAPKNNKKTTFQYKHGFDLNQKQNNVFTAIDLPAAGC